MKVWQPTDIRCRCGGIVEIRDWAGPHEEPDESQPVDPEFRFEAACDTCRECDPNGYATRDEAVKEAWEYFRGEQRRRGFT